MISHPRSFGLRRISGAMTGFLVFLAHAAIAHADSDDGDAGQAKPDVSEIVVTARRLDVARAAIEPSLGASTYTLTNDTVESRPGGEAVKLGHSVGMSEASRRLGIPDSSLFNWVRLERAGKLGTSAGLSATPRSAKELEAEVDRLRREWVQAERGADFDALKACLTGEKPEGGYAALAAQLHSTESAVKVTVHRLRRRFQRRLREEIAETVATDRDVDDEIQYLLRAIRS